MKLSFILFNRLVLMLVMVTGLSLNIKAQTPSFTAPQFVSYCEGLQFCVINPPQGTFYYVIRSIGGANQEKTTTTDPCWTLTIPATQVRATFLDVNRNELPIPGTNLNYIGVSTPNLPPPTITAVNQGPVTNICNGRFRTINLSVNTCVDPGQWEILDQPGLGVQVSLNNGGTGNFVSTKSISINAFGATPGFTSFRIRATAGITGPITKTIFLEVVNCGFFSGDSSAEELLESEGVDPEGMITGEENAVLPVPGTIKPFAGNVSQGTGLRVFPNPVRDQLTIKYDARPGQLRLIDLNGRTVRTLSGTRLGDVATRIDVSDLTTGLYLLETVTNDGTRSVTKVQVNR